MVRVQCTGEGGAEGEDAAKEEEGSTGSSSEASSICTSSGYLPACQSATMAVIAFFCSDFSARRPACSTKRARPSPPTAHSSVFFCPVVPFFLASSTPPPLHPSPDAAAPSPPPPTCHCTPWSSSGYRGVRPRPSGMFYAEIRSGGMRLGLGTFETAHEAARAYDVAAWRLSRPRSQMNFDDARTCQQAQDLAPPPRLIINEDRHEHCRTSPSRRPSGWRGGQSEPRNGQTGVRGRHWR
nr:ethylene-responsive transcription factor ERF107-like [Aegilops tauschii subsp. strangulata]